MTAILTCGTEGEESLCGCQYRGFEGGEEEVGNGWKAEREGDLPFEFRR